MKYCLTNHSNGRLIATAEFGRCSVREMRLAEYGEWNRKGATLSDVTAKKEYGVSHAFIMKGIRAGKLEYRDEAIGGNPYLGS